MKKQRLILLEFNELCPDLLEKWSLEGCLPNFRRFYENSEVFITTSDAENAQHLNPWVQWYSIHTGLDCQQHKVFNLTEGPKANHKDIWQMLLDNKKTVINCSSMNAKRFDRPGSMFLPDPWCTGEQAFPDELNIFYKVVANAVQEHTNEDNSRSIVDNLSFLNFLIMHGLRFQTIQTIIRQLISEKLINKDLTWKRAVLLDKLQFDIFKHYFRRLRPDFSTFFLNSTAHYQHSYWRYMAPEFFTSCTSDEDISKFKNCILFGYQEMDKLLGEFFKFEKEGVTMVLATALSQQPYLKDEDMGGRRYYRPKNMELFLKRLNISFDKVEPVMTSEYMVHFKDSSSRENASQILKSMKYQGEKVVGFDPSGPNTLFFENRIHRVVPKGASIECKVTSEQTESFDFYDLFYQLDGNKSGYHHPDGVLWFKTGNHKVHNHKVSILDILPSILNYYGISINSDLPGKPLSLELMK